MDNILGSNISEIDRIKTEIICKDYIPLHKANYNILAGNGGCGKSMIALKILIHFLRGNPTQKAVAIFTEDTADVIEDRIKTIVSQIDGITFDDVYNRTFFKTLDNHDGEVFAMKINKQNVINQNYFDKFVLNARFYNVGFVILDPFESFHSGLNENDAEDMKFYTTNALQKLGVETGACILALHHTNKGNVGGARGSGVITNKGRIAYNIRKVEKEDKQTGAKVIVEGWEKSVLLTTIKDNHFIARYCDIISKFNGKLDLPISSNTYNDDPKVTIYGGLND